jgi:LemA protein
MDFFSFIALLLLVLIPGIWIYNRLIKNRNLVKEAWAGIDVQLQKRHELVPNLVSTVKAYASHETGLFEEVARIRSDRESSVPNMAKQETTLSRSLGRLFALAEDYPDLKANEGFQQLHSSLIEIEDHLQFARRYYNGAVRDNNNAVESFPSNLLAAFFKFTPAEFFEIEFSAQRHMPDVSL